jgi:hypothetical protein
MPSQAVPADAMVTGGNILSMLAAMGPFRKRGEQILEEHGIRGVHPDQWYPFAAYVAALGTIRDKMGPNTLFQIGKQIPNHVPLPPGLDTFEKVLASFGMAYDMNHRDTPLGVISYRMHDDRHATIVSGTAYPCDFDRGVIQGFFMKLLSARVTVNHDAEVECKRTGGATCTSHVTLPA